MKHAAPLALCAVMLCGGCATPFGARQLLDGLEETPATTIIQDVTVFTAVEGEAPLEHQDVVIRAGKIEALRPTGEAIPAGALLVDGAGRTLLPGFVDAHAHLLLNGAAPWGRSVTTDLEHNLHAHLYAGVTTVFDLGGDEGTIKLRKEVEAGERLGPRIFRTDSPATGKGGHPIPLAQDLVGFPLSCIVPCLVQQAGDPAAGRAIVDEVLKHEADYVKITYDDMPPGAPHMDLETLTAMIETAHAGGKRVAVHATTSEDLVAAAEAGADLLAHGPYRGAVDAEAAARIKATGAPIVATFTGFGALADFHLGAFKPNAMHLEITPQTILGPVTGEAGKKINDIPAMRRLAEAALKGRETWATSIANLASAGVPVLVGTDSALPGTYPGGSFHAELDILAAAGLPLDQLILGATSRAARFVSDKPGFGTVAPGQVADLVLVEGDPLAEVSALHAIVSVWRAGARVRRCDTTDECGPDSSSR